MSKQQGRIRAGMCGVTVLIGAFLAAPASAQELPQGAQTAIAPGGIVFDGGVPGGPLGDDSSTMGGTL